MTEYQGPLTQLNNVLPSGLDATRIAQVQLKGGVSYGQFRSIVAGALNSLNREILQAWGDMLNITNEQFMEYPNGGTIEDFPDITDLDKAELYKGNTVAHMIDLKPKGKGVGGTHRYFRDTRMAIIMAAIRGIVTAGRNTFEKGVLTRALSSASNLLGSAGYDVGFCDASGTLTYAPPAWGGEVFANSHNHYLGYNSSDSKTLADVLNGLAETLIEHGHPPPFKAKVSWADVPTYHGLEQFVKPISSNIIVIDRGGKTSGPIYYRNDRGEMVEGSGAGLEIGSYMTNFGEVILFATNRLTTGYVFMYKSYGSNDARNPIAVRVHPDVGFGFFINEIASMNDQFPVAKVQVEIEYGISVGMDRTVGASGLLVAGGAWADATIS